MLESTNHALDALSSHIGKVAWDSCMCNLSYKFSTSTVKPLYSGHPWGVANWLLYKGGLIIQCTFNREVLFGTLLGGCFREVTFLYRFAIWLL